MNHSFDCKHWDLLKAPYVNVTTTDQKGAAYHEEVRVSVP